MMHLFTRFIPAGLAILLAACQQAAGTAPPSASKGATGAAVSTSGGGQPAAWNDLVAAANKEGTLNLYSAITGDQGRTALVDPFEKAYPNIKVQSVFAPNTDLISRVVAERQSGKYLPDVFVGPGSSGIDALKGSGGLAPLEPMLSLPEVVDTSVWLNNHLWWLDAQAPNTSLGFEGQAQAVMSVNTKSVDPKTITSYQQLLDPKWKGKILARDVRVPGPGGPQFLYLYKHPDLGRPFIEKLFGEMNIMLSTDGRQMIDWLGQGTYSIGLSINSRELREGITQGLPMAFIPPDQLKEGTDLSNAGGTVNMPDRQPHPNAAKVYLNWLLSKDGQLAWQRVTGTPSLRVDVPKDGLDPIQVPKPGITYVASSREDFQKLMDLEVRDIITNALAKGQKQGT